MRNSSNIKDFNQLSADLQVELKEAGGNALAKLHFLDKVLTALSKQTTLTNVEQKTLDKIQKILGKAKDDAPVADQELVEQLMRQMPGPLGRQFIKDNYRSGDGINVSQVASDARNGRLSALTMLSQLKRTTMFRSFMRPSPSDRFIFEGDKLPIDEQEPQLEISQDLSYLKNIHRDAPVKFDIARLASGDLMERTYRERLKLRGTKNPKDNELYIMLYDMSGSMESQNKYVFQAALMASTVDVAQLKVAQGHKVSFLAIPFEDHPHEPTKISSPKQAAEFFKTMMQSSPRGNGGTSITRALQKAMGLIKEAQDNGGELSRAHILVMTDGADSIDVNGIMKIKREITEKTPLSIHTITMGEGNPDLEKIAKADLSNGQKGRSSYQYLGYDQMNQMMNHHANISNLENSARARKKSANVNITSSDVNDLTRAVLELRNESERSLDSNNDYELRQFTRELERPSSESTSTLKQYVDALLALEVANDDAVSRRRSTRLNLAHTYFGTLAKENKIAAEDLLNALTAEEKTAVKNWIMK